MIAFDLNKIRKPHFGCEEIAGIRGISLASAKVTASRYVQEGLRLRLKKNLYVRRGGGTQQIKRKNFDWQTRGSHRPTST